MEEKNFDITGTRIPNRRALSQSLIVYMYIYLLLTAIGVMPGGSVYKVHEHPQYNTVISLQK
jgi:hypothetical protein